MTEIPDLLLEPMVRHALHEDLGGYGDVTTRAVIPAGLTYRAKLNAREAGVVSGLQIAAIAFRLVDATLEITARKRDGEACAPGDTLMEVAGPASAILSAERVALNFAGRLSGIATLTSEFVAETRGTNTRVTCTRKTTPGLRAAEKLAVLHGGGFNHRYGLSDAILIKDNHIAAAGGIRAALAAAKLHASHMLKVEIEVDTLDQLAEALDEGGADVVLLDNMSTPDLAEAVRMVGGRLVTEASGNMRRERVAEVCATGVDYVSSGALTHSARTLDLGLDF
ncbi:carboxylating nicotinate-nucleotide diphosphorylase [Limimaricola pyoseonensis]|uniref:Probable nicotinate-nucleotide pyrophosphorylase [carboxylating] n=1 Tax=Limimaricola pyoseonensis TaxID=521013 RepID=A0A1G7H432_9RHOB|nr:carboxylating nicotinate-nucleotide diphosphorylase [Limimaricola pyoseonensis]SDE95197.1 nicotinate-nucleotide pyrophosphorylase [carboxylating] [Limimaricola pyoseonensis]